MILSASSQVAGVSPIKTPESKRQPTRTRHVPQRSCIGCGKVGTKRELLRLVRTVEGKVEIDRLGKKAGRGAYVCPDPECWHLALKRNRLRHALRTNISTSDIETLAEAKLAPQAGSEVDEGDDG